LGVVDPAFACDLTLGGLARLLRFAGFDTHFESRGSNLEIARLARAENRWLLTCCGNLAARAGPRVLLLRRLAPDDQLAEVLDRLDLTLDPARFLTRCSRCNILLADLTAERAATLVPPFVAAHAGQFRQCHECQRVYWRGSHVARITATLTAAITGG